ncbi:hypothetical protein EDB89DRAFT_1983909 [Lactarius sanguifluus]|nr:hypothetical protein EDB89DRAFT_1983909 [Lactarius sanguifluus]
MIVAFALTATIWFSRPSNQSRWPFTHELVTWKFRSDIQLLGDPFETASGGALFPPRRFPSLIFCETCCTLLLPPPLPVDPRSKAYLRTSTLLRARSRNQLPPADYASLQVWRLRACLPHHHAVHDYFYLIPWPAHHTFSDLILSWSHIRTTSRLAPSTTWRSVSSISLRLSIASASSWRTRSMWSGRYR